MLGARCSYGEWRNPALSSAPVAIAEGCFGVTSCAGVVAWSIGTDAETLPALAPSTATTVVFAVKALQTVTLTKLAGAVTSGNVEVSVLTGSPFTGGGLVSTGWAIVRPSLSWTSPQTITSTPLTAGATYGIKVVAASANALACTHALGDVNSTLLANGALTVMQGVVVTGTALGKACAWSGLGLLYNTTAACAPSPPPPVAFTPATIAGIVLVNTLADLRAALANATVFEIQVNQHITLDGTPLTIGMTGVTARTLTLAGTYSCRTANPATPRCQIRSDGTSRVITVPEGAQLSIVYLELRDGVAPASENGGCVDAHCATCHLRVNDAKFANCSAPSGGGGALSSTLGGGMDMNSTEIADSSAYYGGGVLDEGACRRYG